MNDRFKFRVIRGESPFCKNGDVVYFTLGDEIGFGKDDIIQQCTGLKDKNGKLIYEGDIVKYYYEFQPNDFEIREVKWGGVYKYPAFDIVGGDFDCNGLSYIFAEGMYIEVIGNIWEDRELLER